MNKKIIIKTISTAVLIAPLLVLAQIGGITPGVVPATINIAGTINTVINWVFGLLLAVSVLLIFYAGFLYLVSAGDPEKTKQAINYITYAIIGLVVAFAARGIAAIVRGLLGI